MAVSSLSVGRWLHRHIHDIRCTACTCENKPAHVKRRVMSGPGASGLGRAGCEGPLECRIGHWPVGTDSVRPVDDAWDVVTGEHPKPLAHNLGEVYPNTCRPWLSEMQNLRRTGGCFR